MLLWNWGERTGVKALALQASALSSIPASHRGLRDPPEMITEHTATGKLWAFLVWPPSKQNPPYEGLIQNPSIILIQSTTFDCTCLISKLITLLLPHWHDRGRFKPDLLSLVLLLISNITSSHLSGCNRIFFPQQLVPLHLSLRRCVANLCMAHDGNTKKGH